MFRPLLAAVSLLAIPVAISVPTAHDGASAAQSRTGEECQRQNEGRRRGAGAFGSMARGMLNRVAPGSSNIIVPMGSMLGDAIMNLLDCDEQNKAATATEEVVERAERGGGVGTTTTWESESRPGVTGSSTVTAVENNARDGDCMTVTDIVIVDGEETRAPKRMCRRPPNNRYVRV